MSGCSLPRVRQGTAEGLARSGSARRFQLPGLHGAAYDGATAPTAGPGWNRAGKRRTAYSRVGV